MSWTDATFFGGITASTLSGQFVQVEGSLVGGVFVAAKVKVGRLKRAARRLPAALRWRLPPSEPPCPRRSNRCSPSWPTRCRREGDFLFEPKWDGFRAIVFRPDRGEVAIQSRDLRPLDRYFPELDEALLALLPDGSIVDGEIVVVGAEGLDFDALQQRLHPAASRVAKLAVATPASFVAFDLLAANGKSLVERSQEERRSALEQLLADARPPLYLTPATRDGALAEAWLREFEGAGLDGVVAKPLDAPYQPGKRAMLKIKHVRTADCVVAGFRWHKSTDEGGAEAVGSLLLGLYDDARRAAPRRRDVVVHDGRAPPSGQGARAAAPQRPREPPVARLGGTRHRRFRRATDAGREQPLERRQGPLVAAASARARLRGQVRPSARRPLPPRDDVSCAGAPTRLRKHAVTTSSRSSRRLP